MAFSMNLWKITDAALAEISKTRLDYEERLESWIVKDPSILGIELLPIGRQVLAEFGGKIDLLCVDRQGNLVILELKRDKTPREVVAQVLEYASWVRNLTYDEINAIASDFRKKDLSVLLAESFEEVPENINAGHSMIIVASHLDEASERIVQYLADEYSVNINVVFFTFFKDEKQEFLGRAWLADPEKIQEKAETRKRGIWSGYWFVNVGESLHRNWDDNKLYGYIGAGQGSRYPRALKHLHVGDKIFAYMSGLGYVGYGEVTQEAVMIKDFVLENGTKSLLELPLKAPNARENCDSPELSEWAVAINWIRTYPREEAKSFKGIFANQNVVCKLRDEATVSFLMREFKVSDDA